MKFETIHCHESLQPFIRNYWLLTAQCTAAATQQIFSNGAASLQFYLSQPVRLDDGEREYRTVLVHQKIHNVRVHSVEGAFDVFGAEFVPYCMRVFFRKEMNSIYASPEELQDEELVVLSRKIYEVDSTDERKALLDDFFLKRLADFPEYDAHSSQRDTCMYDNIKRLSDVFDAIIPTDGTLACPPHNQTEFSIPDLAATACLCQKQFTRVFHKYVGMNPKSYLRLLRFHHALQKLCDSHSVSKYSDIHSLTSIAISCGYYDLSHMNNDFRDICGYIPSELLNFGTKLTEAFEQQFSGLMKKKIKIENLV